MSWTSTAVIRTEQTWTVQAQSTAGESAELTYETEAQARYIAAVLSLRPSSLPKQAIMRRLATLPEADAAPTRSRSRRRAS